MRILLKCPTRSRPQQFLSVLQKYVSLASRPDLLGVCVSCDSDDTSMTASEVQNAVKNIMSRTAWGEIYYGNSSTKIEAVNADIKSVTWSWDILFLVSDDMVPQVKGYDEIIRSHMQSKYPDTNGILWINDGTQGVKLNTISIMGRAMYESFGYVYHPAYKSFYCDTEFTDLCNGPLASKCTYIPRVLIRHEHPGTGFPEKNDKLYEKNQRSWTEDMFTYTFRKTYEYDWSILIATIAGREDKLKRLLTTINQLKPPELRIEICTAFDNREKKIGTKRRELLAGAKGKYFSFIDDDDLVTKEYFEDALETIKGGFHCCRLRGQINQYTFTHSIENTLDTPMCVGDVFMRPPNHLNVMLTGVGGLIPFRDLTNGEDIDWAIRLAQTGWITTEYRSDPSRIHYIYNLGHRVVYPNNLEEQRKISYQTMLKTVWIDGDTTLPRRRGLRLTSRGFVST